MLLHPILGRMRYLLKIANKLIWAELKNEKRLDKFKPLVSVFKTKQIAMPCYVLSSSRSAIIFAVATDNFVSQNLCRRFRPMSSLVNSMFMSRAMVSTTGIPQIPMFLTNNYVLITRVESYMTFIIEFSFSQYKASLWVLLGSAKANGREPKTSLGRVFN